jgi:hypothetical protein
MGELADLDTKLENAGLVLKQDFRAKPQPAKDDSKRMWIGHMVMKHALYDFQESKDKIGTANRDEKNVHLMFTTETDFKVKVDEGKVKLKKKERLTETEVGDEFRKLVEAEATKDIMKLDLKKASDDKVLGALVSLGDGAADGPAVQDFLGTLTQIAHGQGNTAKMAESKLDRFKSVLRTSWNKANVSINHQKMFPRHVLCVAFSVFSCG